ncbi:hypothetical protein D5086_023143 [Populus alba]|uniref:Uncharacterized protein n=2 Tax=Populus TaxID=3689 RepID=A0ACC4B9K8_POPAL|nr:hypothetical protein NC653_029092 [Populus alba x Populus x berolinensis]
MLILLSELKETLNDDAWPLSSSPKKVIVAHDQEVAENGVNNSFGAAAGSGCRGWSDLVRKGGLGLRVSQGLLQGCYGRNGEDESGDSDHSVFVEYGSKERLDDGGLIVNPWREERLWIAC